MPALGRDELDTLAALARLSLDDDERDTFVGQLDTIVQFLAQLQTIAVDDVPEYVASMPESELRDDVAATPIDRAEILAGCAHTEDGLVIVPRFMEG